MTDVSDNADLFAALAKAQGEFPAIARTKTVKVTTKTGGTYSFDYAPLDAIFDALRPSLSKHNLSVTQLLTESSTGQPALLTILAHSSGGSIQGTVPLPAVNGMSAQDFGSLVTYYRRYGLVSALGIATEDDDDGNRASGNTAKASAKVAASAASRGAGQRVASPPPDDDVPFAPDLPDVEPQADKLTSKQNAMLGVLVTKLNGEGILTVEAVRAWMDAKFGKTSRASLTKKEASELIEYLKEQEETGGVAI